MRFEKAFTKTLAQTTFFMALGHFVWQPTVDAKGFQSNLFNSSERVSLPVIIVLKHPRP